MKRAVHVLILVLATALPATETAAETIWRWVDDNGRVTFSNVEPPHQARNVTAIESRWTAGENRRAAATGPHGATWPEHHPWREAYDMLLDELYDLRAYADDLRSDLDATRYVLYTPETDYAYSRRYYQGPRRHRNGGVPGRRHPSRQGDHYGQRRYDRSYFGSSYRYRSTLPQFGGNQALSTRTPNHHRD